MPKNLNGYLTSKKQTSKVKRPNIIGPSIIKNKSFINTYKAKDRKNIRGRPS